jgi:hypothetical protein
VCPRRRELTRASLVRGGLLEPTAHDQQRMPRTGLCLPPQPKGPAGYWRAAAEIRFWTSALSRCPRFVVGRLIAWSTAVAAEEVVTSQSDRRIDRPLVPERPRSDGRCPDTWPSWCPQRSAARTSVRPPRARRPRGRTRVVILAVATAPTLRRSTPHHPPAQLLGRPGVHGPHLHPWALLPAKELGVGSASTAWRRLDWSRAGVDSASVRATRGGTTWARIPSIAASRDPGFIWSASGTACR